MHLDVRTIDITAELANTPVGNLPTVIVKRYLGENHTPKPGAGVESHDGAVWQILRDILPKDTADINWSVDNGGTHISVTLYEYKIDDPDPSALVRFGTDLGLLVSHLSKPFHPLERVLVLLSNVFGRPDGHEGFCVYVGVALKQEK